MSHEAQTSPFIVVSPKEYFDQIVGEAFERRKLKAAPFARDYIVDLLQFYVPAANLFDDFDSSGRRTRETLAETYLRAQTAEPHVRNELLKKLGDRSLYISGFFGDSLQRKLVDVDYYIDMGGMAYGALAQYSREDTVSRLYSEFSRRFLDFVEVLEDISSQASLQSEDNLLRLFEVYAKTGSEVAKEKLIERGLFSISSTHVSLKDEQ
jgi:hypothetical protein